jgi:hypothetical protein
LATRKEKSRRILKNFNRKTGSERVRPAAFENDDGMIVNGYERKRGTECIQSNSKTSGKERQQSARVEDKITGRIIQSVFITAET